jgi:hypothetical protein
MSEPFQPIGALAINVLAKCAAKKAVVEQLRSSGNRAIVPHREIVRQTRAYLAEHPELQEQALATAWELSIRDQQGRLNAALFDDGRGRRRPSRSVLLIRSADKFLNDLNLPRPAKFTDLRLLLTNRVLTVYLFTAAVMTPISNSTCSTTDRPGHCRHHCRRCHCHCRSLG